MKQTTRMGELLTSLWSVRLWFCACLICLCLDCCLFAGTVLAETKNKIEASGSGKTDFGTRSKVTAPTTTNRASTAITAASSPPTVIKFPAHSLGQLYFVTWAESVSEYVVGARLADAKGTVTIPAGSKVRLKLAYAMESLKNLESIGLPFVSLDAHRIDSFGDTSLLSLQGSRNLQQLNLDDDDVTDKGLEYLKAFPGMLDLKLNRTEITGAGLKSLRAFPALTRLSLISTRLNDASMIYLLPLKNLKYLMLGKCHLSDKGVETLSSIKSLRYLSLSGNGKITNASIVSLQKLPTLERLELGETGVNAGAIADLRKLPHLKQLQMELSVADLAKAKKSMPACDIILRPNKRVPVDFFAPLK